MRFTKIFLALTFALLIGSIVVPATSSVNRNGGVPNSNQVVADGTPLPLPRPPATDSLTQTADGTPLPLPRPPATDSLTLSADGTPLPLPRPPAIEPAFVA